MARRIGEAVAVRVSAVEAAAEYQVEQAKQQATSWEAPASFIWRDRVYVVREVLGYWRERKAWWDAASARAVHGEVAGEESVEKSGEVVLGEAVGAEGLGLKVAIDHEREVWRVEARGPRTVGTGVYDISREASRVPGEQSSWRLLAVTD